MEIDWQKWMRRIMQSCCNLSLVQALPAFLCHYNPSRKRIVTAMVITLRAGRKWFNSIAETKTSVIGVRPATLHQPSITASTGRATNSRVPSPILVLRPSGDSSSSPSKAVCQRISIGNLGAHGQATAQDGYVGPIMSEGGVKRTEATSVMWSLGSSGAGIGTKESDSGSDDSDRPPSEKEDEEA